MKEGHLRLAAVPFKSLIFEWWGLQTFVIYLHKRMYLFNKLFASCFIFKEFFSKWQNMNILWWIFENLSWQKIFWFFQRWDFKRLNPSETQSWAHIQPKSGLALIRPIRDCSESFLYVADRLMADQRWQGDINLENLNFP